MADRAEFLETIRHRTRVGEYKPTNAPDVAWTREDGPRESAPIEDPPARFIEELETLGGHGKRVETLEEAREYVLSLAQERAAKLVIRWDVEELETLGVDDPLEEAGGGGAVWRGLDDFREGGARAGIRLSTAGGGIADTASLVF